MMMTPGVYSSLNDTWIPGIHLEGYESVAELTSWSIDEYRFLLTVRMLNST